MTPGEIHLRQSQREDEIAAADREFCEDNGPEIADLLIALNRVLPGAGYILSPWRTDLWRMAGRIEQNRESDTGGALRREESKNRKGMLKKEGK